MAKLSKKTTTFLTILICVIAVISLKNILFDEDAQKKRIIKARSLGDPKAAVQIVEFIDFQCPACAYGSKVLKEKMATYPGKIHLQMRYYPLRMHAHAVTASLFAECAAKQNKFWPFHDLVLEQQGDWKKLKTVSTTFYKIAEEAGLDEKRLKVCLDDPATQKNVEEDKQEGKQRGVRSTPTYFINSEMVIGAQALTAKLEQLLSQESL